MSIVDDWVALAVFFVGVLYCLHFARRCCPGDGKK